MNVGELKAALDDYGDHVPVVVVIERGEHEYFTTEAEVASTGRFEGEITVTVTGYIE